MLTMQSNINTNEYNQIDGISKIEIIGEEPVDSSLFIYVQPQPPTVFTVHSDHKHDGKQNKQNELERKNGENEHDKNQKVKLIENENIANNDIHYEQKNILNE